MDVCLCFCISNKNFKFFSKDKFSAKKILKYSFSIMHVFHELFERPIYYTTYVWGTRVCYVCVGCNKYLILKTVF